MNSYSKEKSLVSLQYEILVNLVKQMDLNDLMEFRKTNKFVDTILEEIACDFLVKYNLTNRGNLLYHYIDYDCSSIEKITTYYEKIYNKKNYT